MSPVPVAAQTTSSTLFGVVKTADGAPVADAVVQARSEATGIVRLVVADEAGAFRFELLEPGTWTVAARLADGRVSGSRTVELRLQQAVRLDFVVGSGPSETVTVTAETPLVDPLETAGKLRVTAEQVATLPLAGRTFTDLARLDSSVGSAAPGNFFGERGSVFVVNGQSGRSNTFLVDGLDNNDQISGTTLNSFYSQQVIEEFVLMTHQYAPEFGRASGGVLNVITRRGGNEPGWETFVQGTGERWNSPGDFVASLPGEDSPDAVSRLQAGFWVSGPFRKDKAFYFAAFEHQQADDVVAYTGIDRDGVAGGRIVAPTEDDNLFLRTDFNLSPSHSLMTRLTFDDRTTHGVNVGGLNTPESGFRIEERDTSFAAALTSVLAADLVNEARLLLASSGYDQFANSDRPGVVRPSGIFGGNNLNRQIRDEDRIQLVDNVTWIRGNHKLKFGADVAWSRTHIQTRFNPNGNFLYDTEIPFEPGDCGDLYIFLVQQAKQKGTWPRVPCPGRIGVDDDGDGEIDEDGNILSYPFVYQLIDGQPAATLNDTKIALFAQDQWQTSPRLLLDYGLRYDLSTFVLGDEARVASSIPNGGAGRDYDNVAPRLGFTYTPSRSGRTVLRGGMGVFYDKLVLGFPAVAAITSGTEIGLTFPQGLTLEVTESLIEEEGLDAVLPVVVFPEQLILRFSTATELQTPYTVQANIGVEQAVGKNAALRADFVRASGYHVPLLKDLNPVVCDPDEDPQNCPILPEHRDPTTGSIAAITTEGRSWFTSFDLSWRWQREEGWFSAGYTWSKAEDMGFDPLKGGIALPPDSDNLAGEKGRSDSDRRHRLVVSGDFGLPWLGLRSSGVIQVASGLPFNVTTGSDDNLDGILTDRPPGVGRNTGEETPLAAINELREEMNEFLLQADPDAEPLPPITVLDEPSFAQVDLRLYRPFEFDGGRGRGDVFLQVFNLLDRVNVGVIEGRAISRSFGQPILLAGPPRTVELGVRIGY